MVQKNQRTDQPVYWLVIGGAWLLLTAAPACAWDQADAMNVPDYNAILAEKMSSHHLMLTEDRGMSLMDAALNPPPEGAMMLYSEKASVGSAPFAHRYSAGWQMPMTAEVRTGPVAQFAVDDSRLSCPRCEWVDSNKAGHIASLGWRVDSTMGWISPWAQVSYSHQLNDDIAPPRERAEEMNAENNWVDVSVGANVPFGQNMAAFASFSQSGADVSGEQFIYSLGVSASF